MKFTFACKKVALNDSIKEYAERRRSASWIGTSRRRQTPL